MLVVGNQRSYSDVCQAAEIKRVRAGLIAFDRSISVVRCYAGSTIYDVIRATGHRPPVVPGTGWATIGGCIANDVHGKNHKTHGTFGHYVQAINLNGERIGARTPLFTATVGGLGLTGEIEWTDIRVIPHNPFSTPWLFPLDYIPWYWPAYKKLGLWQYHCVVPYEAIAKLHQLVKDKPLLTVHKIFGDRPSVGMLSFCRAGHSLSMDFAPRHKVLQPMLDDIVMKHHGAVYPAKTSMSAAMFRQSFPRWKEFSAYVAPGFSSAFWQRVSARAGETSGSASL